MAQFAGLPQGEPVALSVSQDGSEIGSASVRRYGVRNPAHTLEPPTALPFGISATVANPRQFLVEGLQPKSRLHTQVVSQLSGRRLAMNWQMDNTSVLRDLRLGGRNGGCVPYCLRRTDLCRELLRRRCKLWSMGLRRCQRANRIHTSGRLHASPREFWPNRCVLGDAPPLVWCGCGRCKQSNRGNRVCRIHPDEP
jgi:hypothetical protein